MLRIQVRYIQLKNSVERSLGKISEEESPQKRAHKHKGKVRVVNTTTLFLGQLWRCLVCQISVHIHKVLAYKVLVILNMFIKAHKGFPVGSVVKNPPASKGATGDVGLIPGLGRFPGGGNGNPLWYSCLENPMDRGAWWATVHRVLKNWA